MSIIEQNNDYFGTYTFQCVHFNLASGLISGLFNLLSIMQTLHLNKALCSLLSLLVKGLAYDRHSVDESNTIKCYLERRVRHRKPL